MTYVQYFVAALLVTLVVLSLILILFNRRAKPRSDQRC